MLAALGTDFFGDGGRGKKLRHAARFWLSDDAASFQCSECGDDEKAARNCDGTDARIFRLVIDGRIYRRCPVAEITDFSRRVGRNLARRKEGHLPASGGTGEQDARMMRAMDILSGEISEIERERMKRK